MQLLVRWAICNFLIFIFIYLLLLSKFFLALNPPLHIIHARISNNLNTECIMTTKKHTSQIIDLVSVLPEFAEQSRFLCRVSVYFGSRLLSMVPLSKSFHMVIFLLQ